MSAEPATWTRPADKARLGFGRFIDPVETAARTTTSLHQLDTADGAKVSGVLRTVPGAETVVCLMHPRQDVTHHDLVPELLNRGFAVWTQGGRSVNNDLSLVHEQALLDVATGISFLRESGWQHIVTLGHSGGGTLYAFYQEQAGKAPGDRLATSPAGRPVALAEAQMPVPDGAIFLAPHPGQGALLLGLIDPSVSDESDPLSVIPELNAFDARNGFFEPPAQSSYDATFIRRYRSAQRDRVARIDAVAKALVADSASARRRFAESHDSADRRASIAPRILTIYRTDADLRGMDLSIDPNERPYGSLFGRRPDLTNYGLVGFARLTTPDAWLSTWSANTTNADFLRCAPGVRTPTLLIELTGDHACFPSDARAMMENFGAADKQHALVRGSHFGDRLAPGEPTGSSAAAVEMGAWLTQRFPAGALA